MLKNKIGMLALIGACGTLAACGQNNDTTGTNNGTTGTNNGTNDAGNNDMSDAGQDMGEEPTLYYVAQVFDVSTGDDACLIDDPGSDIFAIALETTTGDNLGWGEIVWDELAGTSNMYTDISVIDGSAPSLEADDCPADFAADSVVALGCGGWIAIEFKDATGAPVALDATQGQQIRVYEYGGQCGTGTVVDEYNVFVCTDTAAIRGGDAATCTIDVLQGGSGESTGDISGF